MRNHYKQAVLGRLVQEPNLLVDVCAVECSPLGVVTYHLIAGSIGGVAYKLLEQGYSGDRKNIPFAALAAPLRQAFGLIAFSSPASSDCRAMSSVSFWYGRG